MIYVSDWPSPKIRFVACWPLASYALGSCSDLLVHMSWMERAHRHSMSAVMVSQLQLLIVTRSGFYDSSEPRPGGCD